MDDKPLNVHEAATLLGISPSTVYKMTMRGTIPSYRPSGGRVYFKRDELETWIFANRRASRQELEAQALTMKGGRKC